MSEQLALDTPPQPRRIKSHQVCTLPSLQAAIADLMREALELKCARVNLHGFDPVRGLSVSLNDPGDGLLYIKFERAAA